MKSTFKPPGSNRLKLEDEKLLSNFAFNFNLRRYNVMDGHGDGADAAELGGGGGIPYRTMGGIGDGVSGSRPIGTTSPTGQSAAAVEWANVPMYQLSKADVDASQLANEQDRNIQMVIRPSLGSADTSSVKKKKLRAKSASGVNHLATSFLTTPRPSTAAASALLARDDHISKRAALGLLPEDAKPTKPARAAEYDGPLCASWSKPAVPIFKVGRCSLTL
jgi:hypothetical protein